MSSPGSRALRFALAGNVDSIIHVPRTRFPVTTSFAADCFSLLNSFIVTLLRAMRVCGEPKQVLCLVPEADKSSILQGILFSYGGADVRACAATHRRERNGGL